MHEWPNEDIDSHLRGHRSNTWAVNTAGWSSLLVCLRKVRMWQMGWSSCYCNSTCHRNRPLSWIFSIHLHCQVLLQGSGDVIQSWRIPGHTLYHWSPPYSYCLLLQFTATEPSPCPGCLVYKYTARLYCKKLGMVTQSWSRPGHALYHKVYHIPTTFQLFQLCG